MMWSSLEFSYKSDGVYATLIEVFYDAFTMSTDSICADAAEDMDEYEPGSFKCGKGGVTFVVKHTTSEAMTKDQFVDKNIEINLTTAAGALAQDSATSGATSNVGILGTAA